MSDTTPEEIVSGTAPEGFPGTPQECSGGYNGQCCCGCSLLLRSRPSCDHSGDKRGDPCPELDGKFVCLAFWMDGFALTDARPHGSCEMWADRGKPLGGLGVHPQQGEENA